MPRTKKQPEPAPQPPTPPTVNGGQTIGEVLTLPEVAAYLRLPEAGVLQLVEEQGLPARRLGNEWRFFKAAVQQWLSTGSPTPETRKAALLAAAGSFRDDPDLDAIVEEAMRRRGRPAAEGE